MCQQTQKATGGILLTYAVMLRWFFTLFPAVYHSQTMCLQSQQLTGGILWTYASMLRWISVLFTAVYHSQTMCQQTVNSSDLFDLRSYVEMDFHSLPSNLP